MPRGPDNPHGNAFRAEATLLATETAGQALGRTRPRPASGGSSTRAARTASGEPVAYRLVPGRELPAVRAARRRGDAAAPASLTHHLWVTPYRAEERYPGRRLSEPAPRRRRPAALDRRRSRHRGHRPGRSGTSSRHNHVPAAGRLAGDAGLLDRLPCSSPTASSAATRRWTCRRRSSSL